MSVAADTAILKRRVDDYLWRDDSMPLIRLRSVLESHFMIFPRVAIIGGLVRDLARKGAVGFKSDIDLVIDASGHSVSKLAELLGATPNRFGGFAYQHLQWKIDFWALENTWAGTTGHARVESFEDLTRCTFFNWDAVLYDLKSRRVVSAPDYLDVLRLSEIDINLLPTPSIYGNLLRSIRRLLLWNLQPGPKLRQFISDHLDTQSFETITNTERAIYPNPILGHFANFESLADQLYSWDGRTQLNTSFAIQLTLPGILADISSRPVSMQLPRSEESPRWQRSFEQQLNLPGIRKAISEFQDSPDLFHWPKSISSEKHRPRMHWHSLERPMAILSN